MPAHYPSTWGAAFRLAFRCRHLIHSKCQWCVVGMWEKYTGSAGSGITCSDLKALAGVSTFCWSLLQSSHWHGHLPDHIQQLILFGSQLLIMKSLLHLSYTQFNATCRPVIGSFVNDGGHLTHADTKEVLLCLPLCERHAILAHAWGY